MISKMVKQEVGNKYGRLTVLSFSHLDKHKKAFWVCKCDCGTEKAISGASLRKGETKSCGCLAKEVCGKHMKGVTAELSPFWKDGRRKSSSGYLKRYKPEHPRATVRGEVREHHLIMEKMLGRYLYPEEVVHHCNGDITDNRVYNLRLFSSQSEHIAYHNKLRGVHETNKK
jgi:hypothetical protein